VCDQIPFTRRLEAYFVRAVELGPVVAKLVNFSLTRQKVPRTWRTATITPVPKASIVTGPGDLRPISVTAILSRTVERLVVIALLFIYRIGLSQVTPLGVVFLFMLVNWWVKKSTFFSQHLQTFFYFCHVFMFFNVFLFFMERFLHLCFELMRVDQMK